MFFKGSFFCIDSSVKKFKKRLQSPSTFGKINLFSGVQYAGAGLSDWQTRRTQNPLVATPCGFKSRSRHSLAGAGDTDFCTAKVNIPFFFVICKRENQKISGKVLTKINQKVGFRLVTKFGTKGIVNLGKLLPGVGAAVGGGLDFVETKMIADRSYRWFFNHDFSVDKKTKKILKYLRLN